MTSVQPRGEAEASPHGIVVSKNLMVPMRDGVKLAFDIYRPARDGDFVDGALPDDHAPHALRQDRQAVHRDRRLFRPEGLQRRADRPPRPLLLRGVGRLLPRRNAAHRSRRLRHLRVDRSPAVVERQDRHRRQLLRRDHAGPDCARAPAAPDGDLARRGADEQLPEPVSRGRRDAAAHVLGALHPRAGRAGRARRPGQGGRRVGGSEEPPAALPGDAVATGPDRTPPRAAARGHADRLLHARSLRRVLEPDRARLHPVLGPARRHSGHVLDGLVRPVPGSRQRVLRRHGSEERARPSGS